MIQCPALLSASLCASFKDVEHACQKCGTEVEDGRPFCPQCRAPQIHVQIAVPDAEAVAGLNPAPDELSPGTPQNRHSDHPSAIAGRLASGTTMASTIDSRSAVRAALKAGALGILVGMIPVIGVVLTGGLAVFFYRRENGLVLPTALGARLGGAAGIVVFGFNALFIIPIIAFHAQQECIDSILKVAEKYGFNTATPEFQATVQNLFTPSGLAINFLTILIFAAIGGALASLLLRPRNTRM